MFATNFLNRLKKEIRTILLHICCAACASACVERLRKDGYDITGYFYNPNIQPFTEYNKRYKEVAKLSEVMQFQLYTGKYELSRWFEKIKGLEDEPEGGKRCEVCYELRLEETAVLAKKLGIKQFTTTLSVSSHKCFERIKLIGEEIAESYNLLFLPYDFKKKGGFKRSVELSKEYNLYRQNYCGCVFSRD